MASGPPYPFKSAILGGLPTVSLDVPLTAIFIFLFICGAVTHMTIIQLNKRKGNKFIASGVIFGFCMARTVASVMRIAWACKPHNLRIALAATIFVNAGVLLIIIVNLLFAQRILRASVPNIGWHRAVHFAFPASYASLFLVLAALITAIVQSVYTLTPHIQAIDHKIQLFGVTYFAVASFIPLPLLTLAYFLPKSGKVEKFGSGRFKHKVLVLLVSAALVYFGASFRAAAYYMPRPALDPSPIDSKAAFYIVDFSCEVLVIYMYAFLRVDRRFHVPDGSKAPGHYSAGGKEGRSDEEAGVAEGKIRVEGDEEILDCEVESLEGEERKGEEKIESLSPVVQRG